MLEIVGYHRETNERLILDTSKYYVYREITNNGFRLLRYFCDASMLDVMGTVKRLKA